MEKLGSKIGQTFSRPETKQKGEVVHRVEAAEHCSHPGSWVMSEQKAR